MSEQAPTKEQCEGQACENTDRHLWPLVSKPDDPYESIHVTKEGNIGINVCGNVIVMPLREWHRRAGGTPGRALGDDLRPSKERTEAIAIANRLLDEPFADPDDDQRVLARQFLREIERATYREVTPAPEACPKGGRHQWVYRAGYSNSYCDNCGFFPGPAPEPGALQAEVDRMRKLFWLAKEEVIFFSGYDDKSDTWPNIDLYYSPCVNLGDTFAYACADGERLDDSEIDRLITAYKGWAYDGVVAWAALIRKCEPIKPRCTPQYHEARAALESGAAQPPRDGQG